METVSRIASRRASFLRSSTLAISAWFLAAACGSSTPAATGGTVAAAKSNGTRAGVAAPPWFTSPPKSPSALFFVGDATGASDEAAAREAAKNKALAELTTYCGAQIKSEGQSIEREANGKYEQVVSLTVDVAGDELTVREAVIEKTVVGKASDGTFDGYVLLRWPKEQYDAVLSMQKDRAKRALALQLDAEEKAKELDVPGAKRALKDAKAILGPMKATVPLDHDKYKNTSLLWDAMTALSDKLESLDKERKAVFAVVVECLKEGKPTSCNPSRAGTFRTALSKVGRKVSAEAIPPSTARDILSSENPNPDKAVRSAGYVVAVRYTADLQGIDGPFTFIKYGARGVLFDTSTNRIVSAQEIAPEKEGHPNFDGAMEKGFNNAEKQLLHWLEEQVPKIR
jgi:hypothetical protein